MSALPRDARRRTCDPSSALSVSRPVGSQADRQLRVLWPQRRALRGADPSPLGCSVGQLLAGHHRGKLLVPSQRVGAERSVHCTRRSIDEPIRVRSSHAGLRMTRARDVLVAGAGIFLFAPMFLAIALAVRLDSPGPVFFRQVRVGWQGRPFRIHKFRSMRVGETGTAVSTAGDPRVTRVGRFLRRTKIDELPQLIDVLRGDMSLVGPRPEVPQFVELVAARASF